MRQVDRKDTKAFFGATKQAYSLLPRETCPMLSLNVPTLLSKKCDILKCGIEHIQTVLNSLSIVDGNDINSAL